MPPVRIIASASSKKSGQEGALGVAGHRQPRPGHGPGDLRPARYGARPTGCGNQRAKTSRATSSRRKRPCRALSSTKATTSSKPPTAPSPPACRGWRRFELRRWLRGNEGRSRRGRGLEARLGDLLSPERTGQGSDEGVDPRRPRPCPARASPSASPCARFLEVLWRAAASTRPARSRALLVEALGQIEGPPGRGPPALQIQRQRPGRRMRGPSLP